MGQVDIPCCYKCRADLSEADLKWGFTKCFSCRENDHWGYEVASETPDEGFSLDVNVDKEQAGVRFKKRF